MDSVILNADHLSHHRTKLNPPTGLVIVVLFLVAALPYYIHAHPVLVRKSSSTPDEAEEPWRSEPEGRGTIGILLPCLITLGLCVWTAVHLNVDEKPRKHRLLGFKLLWLLMGVFAPEIVLWRSIDQFLETRALLKAMHTARPDLFTSGSLFPNDISNHSWWPRWLSELFPNYHQIDNTWAHFVVMGGYTVIPDSLKDRRIGNTEKSFRPVTLTPAGILLLFKCGLFKPGSEDIKSIDDKNKADLFAKVLVCVQALWMVLQCTARVSSELPVTLLEGHTIAHVICALCMYVFWWNKPSDVRYPIQLDLPDELKQDIYYSAPRLDLRIEILPVAEGDPDEKSTPADGTHPAASVSTDQGPASVGNSDTHQETGEPTASASKPVMEESAHRAASDRPPLPEGLRYEKTEIYQGPKPRSEIPGSD